MDVITTRGITKRYRVGVGRARIREMLPHPFDQGVQKVLPRWWRRNTFNALEGVSLSVEAGSSVGLVGHNGAGKTTLLKVIAQVTEPSDGAVIVKGRIAALIDALVGFHPDLTGRENVYLLGAMHGFPRSSMARRIDRILEFAEIDVMADTPVKRFSAGMAARLGFATITALDVDILLVDEVLAVGDAAYQRKCIDWLERYRAQGGTLLFVSHNLGLVKDMTERVIWLDSGHVVDEGPTAEILGRYAKAMERRRDPEPAGLSRKDVRRAMVTQGQSRWGAGGARVGEVHFNEPSGNGGPELDIAITYETKELDQAVFCIGFVDEGGREIGAAASGPLAVHAHQGAVRCVIRPLPLRSGIYFPVVAILSLDGRIRDRWMLDRAVVVDGNGERALDFGAVSISASWSAI